MIKKKEGWYQSLVMSQCCKQSSGGVTGNLVKLPKRILQIWMINEACFLLSQVPCITFILSSLCFTFAFKLKMWWAVSSKQQSLLMLHLVVHTLWQQLNPDVEILQEVKLPPSPHPTPPWPGSSLIQMKCSANCGARCCLYTLPYWSV